MHDWFSFSDGILSNSKKKKIKSATRKAIIKRVKKLAKKKIKRVKSVEVFV